MSRLRATLPALALGLLVATSAALLATDPPHKIATANAYGTLNYCSTCHKIMGGATGAALTIANGNKNLCQSCHVSGGQATNKPMPDSDQAVPGSGSLVGSTAGGVSHRWDSSAAGRVTKGSPNTSTGTITPSGDFTGAYPATIQIKVTTGGATGTATVDWSQTTNNTTTFGTATTITTSTAAQALTGTGVSLAFSSTGTFVLNDIFYIYVRPDLVNPTSAMSTHTELGKVVCSTCHDQHLQVNVPFDPSVSTAYTAGTTNNHHFQRLPNDSDQMCVDCHSPRNVTAKGGASHPITLALPGTSDFKTPTTAVLSRTSNVGCQSCHDIHKAPVANGNLLRVEPTGATAGASPLCDDCHTYATVATNKGVHFDSTKGVLWPGGQWVTPSSATPASSLSTYPAFNYATDAAKRATCVNCHDPHGWPDARTTNAKYAKLLVDDPSNLCLACHDANGQVDTTGGNQAVPDVQAEITKATSRHPIERTSGRTVACVDCHNPHKAMAGSHAYSTTATSGRNLILNGSTVQSGPLMGADGIAPTWGGAWTTTSTYAAKAPATYEYEVCFKCHTSYDSYGATRPGGITNFYNTGTAKFTNGNKAVTGTGTTWTAIMAGMYIQKSITSPAYKIASATATSITLATPYAGPTDASAAAYTITREETDLAQEFNPANKSYHPVAKGLTGGGSSALTAAQMSAPWKTNLGTQTMMCSDCHNTDGTAAQGPHGSAVGFMLRGPNTYWPTNSSGALYNLGNKNTTTAFLSGLFCLNCHPMFVGGSYNQTNWSNNKVHFEHSGNQGTMNLACVGCHIQIPHGGKVSRLIATKTSGLPARYAGLGNPSNVKVSAFKKSTSGPGGYSTSNCSNTGCGGHGSITAETW